ncbi:hypothetical protein ACEPAG_9404 [Sanghuangporus baumii]
MGTEISRLQPPTSFVVSLVVTGRPPNLPSASSVIAAEQQGKSEKPAVRFWLYPPTDAGVKEISPEMSSFRRRRRRDFMRFRKGAANIGSGRLHELNRSFNDATHYLIAWTFINHRHTLLAGYSS